MIKDHIESAIIRAEKEHAQTITEPPRGYWVNEDGILLKKIKHEFYVATSHQHVAHKALHIIKYIEEGLEWPLEQPYTNSAKLSAGGFSWCGAFYAWCEGGALKREIRRKILPSTYRLWENYRGTDRAVALDDIQRGDVVVIGRGKGKRWGQHICRAIDVDETHVTTIEGNAHGVLGDGSWGEGVVRRKRPFQEFASQKESYIMFAYRFLPEDYEEE
jgi:hypothetical protein